MISGWPQPGTDIIGPRRGSMAPRRQHASYPQTMRSRSARRSAGLRLQALYLALGVEHIGLGIDHLLFVLALLFLVGNWTRLIGTVTAFTVAHSITLAAATFGLATRAAEPDRRP